MNTITAIAALTATATVGIVAPGSAVEASVPTAQSTSASGMDFMGRSVNFEAAAQAEGMHVPTRNYQISARFGQAGPYWSSGRHTGIDFAAPIGTTIMAVESGKVVSAGPAGAYGNMIEIAHGDGTRSLYAHLSDIDVKVGQKVQRGEHIGNLGNTGNSTGPHLHFEIKKKGTPVDPEKFLNL
jgi:murein DD-endopeptidase MepM/ murein hydrolase activator NlpD